MKAPGWIVPVLLMVAAAGGVGGSRLFAAPSLVRDYAETPPSSAPRTAEFVVQGVRCVDTAARAAQQLDGAPGVFRLTAWASQARLEVTFDPAVTDASALRDAIEGPVYDESTGEFRFGVYVVREIDGVKVKE